jgi:uncharacterized protein YdhG (YjbR/CyaY superfamily)
MTEAGEAKVRFTTVEQYLGTFPDDVRTKLEAVRAAIREVAPDATEGISYQIPGFKMNYWFVYYSGWKDFISMYPVPAGDEAFRAEAAPYLSGKSTMRFPLDRPLPLQLIAKVARLRLADDAEAAATKAAKKEAARAAKNAGAS